MTQTPLLTLLLVLENDSANQNLIYQVRIAEDPQIRRIFELKINPLHKICVKKNVLIRDYIESNIAESF